MDGFNGSLSKMMLKALSGEFDIESIHTLNLRDMALTDLGCLGECSGLERLNLAKNDLTKLYTLAGLTNLLHLNLSMNRISSLEGLQTLDNLASLNLAGNLIGSLDTLRCLQNLEKLEELRLNDPANSISNPVCMNTSYVTEVLDLLPGLLILDGERVRGEGSDLYRLCTELDKTIEERENKTHRGFEPDTSQWLSPEFWDNTTSAQYEANGLESSEKQLEGMISECQRLVQSADEKLQSLTTQPTYITNPGS